MRFSDISPEYEVEYSSDRFQETDDWNYWKFFWMSKLPVVSGEDVVKVLSKQGFTVRKVKGDHVVLQRNDNYRNVTVPLHKGLRSGNLFRKNVTVAVRNPSKAEDIRPKSDETCAIFNPYFGPSS